MREMVDESLKQFEKLGVSLLLMLIGLFSTSAAFADTPPDCLRREIDNSVVAGYIVQHITVTNTCSSWMHVFFTGTNSNCNPAQRRDWILGPGAVDKSDVSWPAQDCGIVSQFDTVSMAGPLGQQPPRPVQPPPPPPPPPPPVGDGAGNYEITPVEPYLVDDEFKVVNQTNGNVILNIPCCGAPIPSSTTFKATIGDVLRITATDVRPPCFGFNSFLIRSLRTGVIKLLIQGVQRPGAAPGSFCGAPRPSYPAVYVNTTFTIDF